MPLRRRFAAALSSLFLLQLTLLGSGSACALRDHGMTQASGTMTAMAEHGASPASSGALALSESTDPGAPRKGCGTGESCQSPWMPRHCATMTSCATSVVVQASTIAVSAVARVSVGVPASVGHRLGPVFAPEPPPPRA